MIAPRFTSIIIVYNGEKFLAEAIDSVISQTETAWELIIVDDGSTDISVAIAEGYKARHPDRIRILFHPDRGNHGMSASRNLGIAAARADLIAFLDCDDVWQPYKLAEQIELFDRHPSIGLAYGRTQIWHSWQTGHEADDYFYDLGVDPDRVYAAPELLPILIKNRAQSPTTCSAAFRRQVSAAVGGFENEFRGMFEDQAFFAKALLVTPTYVSDHMWARYRQHGNSTTARSVAHRSERAARIRFLTWLAKYIGRQRPVPMAMLLPIGNAFLRELANSATRLGLKARRIWPG